MTSISRGKLMLAVPSLALGLALVLASCGGDGGTAAPGLGPEPTIGVAESSFGEILVDAEGNTLYAFTQDRDGLSVCYDECAANWPALTSDATLRAGEGIEGSLLGTAARAHGSQQVTYAGMPMYYFAGDAGPADTNGQGVGDVWFVVSPEGAIIERAALPGGYGYGSGAYLGGRLVG